MNDEEIQEIESSEHPASAFIRLWTMKEATMKLIGTGISNDMKSVIDIHTYKYTTVDRQRYIYTVCEELI
jgi:4'-phosphopantetheinyl transferase